MIIRAFGITVDLSPATLLVRAFGITVDLSPANRQVVAWERKHARCKCHDPRLARRTAWIIYRD